jgi:hypothetical protein
VVCADAIFVMNKMAMIRSRLVMVVGFDRFKVYRKNPTTRLN